MSMISDEHGTFFMDTIKEERGIIAWLNNKYKGCVCIEHRGYSKSGMRFIYATYKTPTRCGHDVRGRPYPCNFGRKNFAPGPIEL